MMHIARLRPSRAIRGGSTLGWMGTTDRRRIDEGATGGGGVLPGALVGQNTELNRPWRIT